MWYKIALRMPELWNIEKTNDPKDLDNYFIGIISSDLSKPDVRPYDIYNNLIKAKEELNKLNPNDSDIINDSFENAISELKINFPDFDEFLNINENWLEEAESWIGTPYKFGGDDRDGIDCSAFVQKVFPEKNLPRVASDQQNVGTSIPVDDMSLWEPGDRLYFDMTARKTRGQGIADHTGIYLGNGEFIQASTSSGVTKTKLSDTHLKNLVSVMR